jgi:hypothetical protein
MTHNTKWILGCLGGLAFLVVCGIVGIVVLVRVLNTPESKQEYEAKLSEGREFGKTMDQAGCMKEGFARAKTMTRFEISRSVQNSAFVEGCLTSSRPTPDFCNGVPAAWKLQDNDWKQEQCERIGMDYMQTGCTSVFDAKLDVCRNQ